MTRDEEHRDAGCIAPCGICGALMAMPDLCSECQDAGYEPGHCHDMHGWICSCHTNQDLLAASMVTCVFCGAPIGDAATIRSRGRMVHARCAGMAVRAIRS